jgi:hypothetical protein
MHRSQTSTPTSQKINPRDQFTQKFKSFRKSFVVSRQKEFDEELANSDQFQAVARQSEAVGERQENERVSRFISGGCLAGGCAGVGAGIGLPVALHCPVIYLSFMIPAMVCGGFTVGSFAGLAALSAGNLGSSMVVAAESRALARAIDSRRQEFVNRSIIPDVRTLAEQSEIDRSLDIKIEELHGLAESALQSLPKRTQKQTREEIQAKTGLFDEEISKTLQKFAELSTLETKLELDNAHNAHSEALAEVRSLIKNEELKLNRLEREKSMAVIEQVHQACRLSRFSLSHVLSL